MAEMKYIIWAICALTVVTGIVLVLRYRWFLKQISEEENGKTHFADFLLSHKADAQVPNNLESQLASVDVGETL